MKTISVNAPAKINFGLNIVSRRADGYHNIETIFYPVRLYDTLIFSASEEFTFTVSDPSIPSDDSNLVVRAKNELETAADKKINAAIHLKKNIPVGGGMGGGSSDAASTLLTLNDLFDCGLSLSELKKIAVSLGSDVPFFLNPVPSFGESRGEILTPIELKIEFPLLIVKPAIHISTAWAYRNCKPAIPKISLRNLNGIISEEEMIELRTKVVNNFEQIVFDDFPEIREIKQKMYQFGALFSLMTGSGSAVFGIFKNNFDAEAAKEFFQEKYLSVIC